MDILKARSILALSISLDVGLARLLSKLTVARGWPFTEDCADTNYSNRHDRSPQREP
jgi:hypothetical protein